MESKTMDAVTRSLAALKTRRLRKRHRRLAEALDLETVGEQRKISRKSPLSARWLATPHKSPFPRHKPQGGA